MCNLKRGTRIHEGPVKHPLFQFALNFLPYTVVRSS